MFQLYFYFNNNYTVKNKDVVILYDIVILIML